MGVRVAYRFLKGHYITFKNKYDVKSIKLCLLIGGLIVGTILCVRKVDNSKVDIKLYVENHLPVLKGYHHVSVGEVENLDSARKVFLVNHLKNVNKTFRIQLSEIKVIEDKFRLNDTLYKVEIFLNKKGHVISMSLPIRSN